MLLGIGGFELLLIVAIGVFVLGPKRVAEMLRDIRSVYSELRRQRQKITTMVEDELEIEELRKETNFDDISQEAREIRASLALDDTIPEISLNNSDRTFTPERFTLGSLIGDDHAAPTTSVAPAKPGKASNRPSTRPATSSGSPADAQKTTRNANR